MHTIKKMWKQRCLAAGLLFGAMTLVGTARATDLDMAGWVERLKISGDFRLREDVINYTERTRQQDNGVKTNNKAFVNRDRARYRLRIAIELPLQNGVTVKTRFASGTGEQTSTNQTFAQNSTQKSIFTDRAFVEWKTPVKVANLAVYGGRMANPLWTQYASDIIWDDDYSPEGFAEKVDFRAGEAFKVFWNELQMMVDEKSKTPRDQWLVSHQIGAEVKLPMDARLKIAGAIHDWIHLGSDSYANGGFSSTTTAATTAFTNANKVQDGNRRGGANELLNNFYVQELTAELSGWVGKWPLSIQGTILNNSGAKGNFADGQGSQSHGLQSGVIFGKAAMKKSWEAAYFYKWAQTDVTPADVADSDFGDGGTNRKGYIMWFAYNPQDWLQLKARYITSQKAEFKLGPSANKFKDIDRVQLDANVKF